MAGTVLTSMRIMLGLDTTGVTSGVASAKSQLTGLQTAVGAISVAATGMFVGSVSDAMEWESALAGIAKTLDTTGLSVEQETAAIAEMGDGIRDMAREIPIGTTELAGLAETAGQLGIRRQDVLDFTRVTALLGVTTNLASDQAATAFGKINAVMPLTADQFDRFGATLVDLGNKGSATESEITDMAQGMAGAAGLVRMSHSSMLGWAAAIANVGIESQAGASSFQRMVLGINAAASQGGDRLDKLADVAGMASDQFAQLWSADASSALQAIVAGLSEMDQVTRQATLAAIGFTDIRTTRMLLSLTNNVDNLNNSLTNAGTAWDENTALLTEAEKRFATAESQVGLLKNTAADLSITIGTVLLPFLLMLVTGARDIASALADWAAANPELVSTLTPILAVLSGILALKFGARLIGMLLPIPNVFSTIGTASASNFIGSLLGRIAQFGIVQTVMQGLMFNTVKLVMIAAGSRGGLLFLGSLQGSIAAGQRGIAAVFGAFGRAVSIVMGAAGKVAGITFSAANRAALLVGRATIVPLFAVLGALLAPVMAIAGGIAGAALSAAIAVGAVAGIPLLVAAIVIGLVMLIANADFREMAFEIGRTIIDLAVKGVLWVAQMLIDAVVGVVRGAFEGVVGLVGEVIGGVIGFIKDIVGLLAGIPNPLQDMAIEARASLESMESDFKSWGSGVREITGSAAADADQAAVEMAAAFDSAGATMEQARANANASGSGMVGDLVGTLTGAGPEIDMAATGAFDGIPAGMDAATIQTLLDAGALSPELAASLSSGAGLIDGATDTLFDPLVTNAQTAADDAIAIARATPQTIADEINANQNSVSAASKALKDAMTNPIKPAKEIAQLEAQLTGKRMTKALNHWDPEVRARGEAWKAAIEERLVALRTNAGGIALATGVSFNDQLALQTGSIAGTAEGIAAAVVDPLDAAGPLMGTAGTTGIGKFNTGLSAGETAASTAANTVLGAARNQLSNTARLRGYGEGLVRHWASGIINAMASAVRAAEMVAAAVRAVFITGSPPHHRLLHNIGDWGFDTIATWVRGIQSAIPLVERAAWGAADAFRDPFRDPTLMPVLEARGAPQVGPGTLTFGGEATINVVLDGDVSDPETTAEAVTRAFERVLGGSLGNVNVRWKPGTSS